MYIKIQNNSEYPELKELHFSNDNMTMTVIPNANMVISSLKYKNHEVLAQREGLKSYIEDKASFAFPFMAPWINRLSTTEYDFDGKHYSYSLNGMKVDENGYAMHGLLTASPSWEYSIEEAPSSMSVTGVFNYDSSVKGFAAFPFEHKIELTYTLTKSSLIVKTKITNKHDGRIPVAFGFHPHYSEAKRITVYGTEYRIPVNAKTIPVKPIEFNSKDTDKTADMCKMLDGWHVDLNTAAGNVKITTKGYPYMLIWSPDANYVAIEPMTSNIDFFNTDGTVIEKDAEYEATYTVSF